MKTARGRFRPLALLFAGAVLACLGACATPQPHGVEPLAVWTQLGRDGLQVRAIVGADQACPPAEVDGVARVLSERAGPDEGAALAANPAFRPRFPVRGCELNLPSSATAIGVAGRRLTGRPATLNRIVVFGDTGCRVKVAADGRGDPVQDCADPAAWPWARLAKAAAATRPDLVVHLGDYHYREYCDDPRQCAALTEQKVVLGYGWNGWQADFFEPAAPLFAAAPWLMVRGNHENCDRAGEGWMRFLSPDPYRACPDQRLRSPSRSTLANNLTADAFVLSWPGLDLGVVDNAAHEDYRPAAQTADDAAAFRRTLAPLRRPAVAGRSRWLLTHRPLWYDLIAPDSEPNAFQQAIAGGALDATQLIFSGHHHGFQTLNFAAGRPAQVIVGGGGTQLEARDPASLFYEGSQAGSRERQRPTGRRYDGQPASSGLVLNRDGFLLLERRGGGWDGELRDPDGKLLARCRVDDGAPAFDCHQREPARQ